MTAETAGRMTRRGGGFGPTDATERNFFLCLLAGVWIGILGGFGTDVVDHIRTGAPPYPLLVHVHAALFVAWLVLLTVQTLLIRGHRVVLHRRLGLAAAFMIPAMVVVGVAAAWVVHLQRYTPEHPGTAFFSVELTGLLAFAGLAGAGLWRRTDPAAHKRLMLLSTLSLSSAGFARLWDFLVGDVLGDGFWPLYIDLFLLNGLLILALGLHDLIRHRRLHPAYLAGVAWILLNNGTAVGLYFSPAWRAFAPALLGY